MNTEEYLQWLKFDLDYCKKKYQAASLAYKEALNLASKKPAPVTSPQVDSRQLNLFETPPETRIPETIPPPSIDYQTQLRGLTSETMEEVPSNSRVQEANKPKKVIAPSIPVPSKKGKRARGLEKVILPPPVVVASAPVVEEPKVTIAEVNQLLVKAGMKPLDEENPMEFYEEHTS